MYVWLCDAAIFCCPGGQLLALTPWHRSVQSSAALFPRSVAWDCSGAGFVVAPGNLTIQNYGSLMGFNGDKWWYYEDIME
jgi:hypothetical protein